MSAEECTIKLLAIQAQIAACHAQEGKSPWLITATLRDKARSLAAAFVDPSWQEGEHPALRDGKAMAADVDKSCGF